MLNLNQNSNPESDVAIAWKVLIYDKHCQDIISPVLRLGDLREQGITLHIDRHPIPDVPAIYFVNPTIENINRIGQDLKNKLYDSMYINFSSTLPRALLEELASLAVQTNSTSLISQIYDQYLNYICLEPNLFSLEISRAYHTLHNPTTPDSKIEQLVDEIATSLFSVIVTFGNVPIIKCQQGNVAEAVGRKLDAKLRDNIISRASLFADKFHMSRHVLILLDRNIDLATMFSHSWMYSPLFQDMFEMKLNRVNARVEERGQMVQKTYDIDVVDSFWVGNASKPLPEVGIFIEEETKKYKELVNSVGGAALENDPNGLATTSLLNSTIDQLPELRLRQKILDMHTVLATNLLNNIVKRQLDSFISMEESISKLNTATILQVIRDPAKDPQDKLRLFLIYFMNQSNLPKEEVAQIEIALKEAGCDVSSISYMKQVHMYAKMSVASQQSQNQPTADLFGSFTSNFSKLTDSLQTTGIGEGFGNLIAGVKNMLPIRKELPVTEIVDGIMEATGAEDFVTFDPKTPKSTVVKKQTFQDAIVFIIGGGNYNEYQNLLDYVQRSNLVKKSILYGSTELLNAKSFIDQLSGLGLD